LVGDVDEDGKKDGEVDSNFAGREVYVGMREGRLASIGLDDDIGITGTLMDEVAELPQKGTSHLSHNQMCKSNPV
jgi:hypothetical protein